MVLNVSVKTINEKYSSEKKPVGFHQIITAAVFHHDI